MSSDVQNQARKINCTWTMLKVTYGVVPIVAGADKFFNMITNWELYLNPMIPTMSGLSPLSIMYAVGVIEVVAGILVLFACTRLGAYIVAAWLVLVALSLFAMGAFYDIAIRDIVMAVGAIALAKLTEVRESLLVK